MEHYFVTGKNNKILYAITLNFPNLKVPPFLITFAYDYNIIKQVQKKQYFKTCFQDLNLLKNKI